MENSDVDRRMVLATGYAQKAPKSVCYCGHTGDGANSQHDTAPRSGEGHGECTVATCGCTRFTWKNITPEFAAFLKGHAH